MQRKSLALVMIILQIIALTGCGDIKVSTSNGYTWIIILALVVIQLMLLARTKLDSKKHKATMQQFDKEMRRKDKLIESMYKESQSTIRQLSKESEKLNDDVEAKEQMKLF